MSEFNRLPWSNSKPQVFIKTYNKSGTARENVPASSPKCYLVFMGGDSPGNVFECKPEEKQPLVDFANSKFRQDICVHNVSGRNSSSISGVPVRVAIVH